MHSVDYALTPLIRRLSVLIVAGSQPVEQGRSDGGPMSAPRRSARCRWGELEGDLTVAHIQRAEMHPIEVDVDETSRACRRRPHVLDEPHAVADPLGPAGPARLRSVRVRGLARMDGEVERARAARSRPRSRWWLGGKPVSAPARSKATIVGSRPASGRHRPRSRRVAAGPCASRKRSCPSDDLSPGRRSCSPCRKPALHARRPPRRATARAPTCSSGAKRTSA